jgi:Xaa-Pro aminopeptidase
MIDVSILDVGERAWLDAYHARVRKTLSSLVDDATRAWLDTATAPLA